MGDTQECDYYQEFVPTYVWTCNSCQDYSCSYERSCKTCYSWWRGYYSCNCKDVRVCSWGDPYDCNCRNEVSGGSWETFTGNCWAVPVYEDRSSTCTGSNFVCDSCTDYSNCLSYSITQVAYECCTQSSGCDSCLSLSIGENCDCDSECSGGYCNNNGVCSEISDFTFFNSKFCTDESCESEVNNEVLINSNIFLLGDLSGLSGFCSVNYELNVCNNVFSGVISDCSNIRFPVFLDSLGFCSISLTLVDNVNSGFWSGNVGGLLVSDSFNSIYFNSDSINSFQPSPGEFISNVESGFFDNLINDKIAQGWDDTQIFNLLTVSLTGVLGYMTLSQRRRIYNYINSLKRNSSGIIDFIKGFIFGSYESDNFAELSGDFVGGMIAYGDIRDIALYLLSKEGLVEREYDEIFFGFSIFGLFTEFFDVADAFATGLKLIWKNLPDGIKTAWTLFFKKADDLSEFINIFVKKLSNVPPEKLRLFFSSFAHFIVEVPLNKIGELIDLFLKLLKYGDDFVGTILRKTVGLEEVIKLSKYIDDVGESSFKALVDVLSADEILTVINEDIIDVNFLNKMGNSFIDFSFDSNINPDFLRIDFETVWIDNAETVVNTFQNAKNIDLSDVKIVFSDDFINSNLELTNAAFNPRMDSITFNLNYLDPDNLITYFHEYMHRISFSDSVRILNTDIKDWSLLQNYAREKLGRFSGFDNAVNSLFDTSNHKLIIDAMNDGTITQFTTDEYIQSVIKRYNLEITFMNIIDGNFDSISDVNKVFISELSVLISNTDNSYKNFMLTVLDNLKNVQGFEDITELSIIYDDLGWGGTNWR